MVEDEAELYEDSLFGTLEVPAESQPLPISGAQEVAANSDYDDTENFTLEEDFDIDQEDDGFSVPKSYHELTAQVLKLFLHHGLTGSILAAQAGQESEMLTQALAELKITASFEARGFILQQIYIEVEKAATTGRLQQRLHGDFNRPKIGRMLDAVEYQLKKAKSNSASSSQSLPISTLPVKGTFAARTRPGVALATVQSKATREAEILSKVQALIIFYVIESNVPIVSISADTADQRRALSNMVGKSRCSTVNTYTKKWTRMREWLLMSGLPPWPLSPGPLVDYLHMLGDEPCGPSVPQAWYQAVLYFYKLGGFAGDQNPALSPIVVKSVEKLTTELGQFRSPILQAARYPVAVLAALELYICNTSHPPFKRLHSGYMLLKSWGTLRFDDAQRIRRETLRKIGKFVQTDLLSSKTSGPGKRVRQLPVAVSTEAQLLDLDWLDVFLKLLTKHLPNKSEFLMEQCTSDFERTTGKEMRYRHASALSKIVLSELRIPTLVAGSWVESEVPPVPTILLEMFSEHSARSVVPSLAIFVEEDKEKRNMIGRWRPSGSDDYCRTFRHVVGIVQNKIALALKAGEGAGRMQEGDVVDRAGRFLRERLSADEETVNAVCTDWSVELERFAKYLGNNSQSLLVSDEVLVPVLPLLTPATSHLLTQIHHDKTRVVHECKYLVAYSSNRKVARLHLALKGCYWAGTELKDSKLLDEAELSPALYNSRCKFCFPVEAKTAVTLDESESESSSSEDSA